MRHPGEGQERALGYLRRLVGSLAGDASLPMPLLPMRELARNAGVAYVTMHKATQRLSSHGIVRAVRGRRLHLLRALPPVLPQDVTPPLRALPARERMGRDLRLFLLRHPGMSALPSVKELCATFGCSYRAMKAALEELCEQKFIVRRGRTYCTGAGSSPRPAMELWLCACGDPQGRYSAMTQVREGLLRAFESGCAVHGLLLRVFVFPFVNGRTQYPETIEEAFSTRKGGRTLAGIVVLPLLIHDEQLVRIAASAARAQAPVATVDETSERDLGPLSSAGASVREWQIGSNRVPGETAAHFLLARGHRRFAWFSASAESLWSRNRRDGFCEHVSAMPGSGVKGFEVDEERWSARTHVLGDDLWARMERSIGGFDRVPGIAPRTRDSTSFTITQALSQMYRVGALDGVSRPLFDRAARCHDITAWVVSNDELGVMAQAYMRAHPRLRPSLLSFDNSSVAASERITSYDFGCDELAALILDDLRQNRVPRPGGPPRALAPVGSVVERATTQRVVLA